jgi:uncharacterized protein (DUF2267 family)
MSKATLSVFQNTLHKSEEWLHDVMAVLEWDDEHQAYRALRAVLHSLRDRLTVEEAADLAAQLPMLVRGLFFEGWKPSRTPNRIRSVDEFVSHVDLHLPTSGSANYIEPAEITRGVLKVLMKHVSRGEIEDIIHSLPVSLRELFD